MSNKNRLVKLFISSFILLIKINFIFFKQGFESPTRITKELEGEI